MEGTADLEAGRLEEAEAAFEEAIRVAPASPEGYLGLAQVQSRLGREELAILLQARAEQLRAAERGPRLEGAREIPEGEAREALAIASPGKRRFPRARRARTAGTRNLGIGVVAVVASLCGLSVAGWVALNPPVGLVGNRLVSQAELRREIHALALDLVPEPYLNRNTSGFDSEAWYVRHNAWLQRLVLKELLRREALRELSKELGRTAGRREAMAALRELRASPTWQQVARARVWDAEEWQRQAELVALEKVLLESLPDPGTPTAKEVEAFYRQNRPRFADEGGRMPSFAEIAPYLRKQLSLDRRFARLRDEIGRRAGKIPTRFWTPLMPREVRP